MSGKSLEQIHAELKRKFRPSELEWRLGHIGETRSEQKIYATCFCYITARAVMKRLDDVFGPTGWMNTPLQVIPVVTQSKDGKVVQYNAMQVGISAFIEGQWITKYDVSDPTDIEPVKGGFSGAMKRAGAQWGIGRYLYALDESYAIISEQPKPGFKHAVKNKRDFYWSPPPLPGWAIPEDGEVEGMAPPDTQVSAAEVVALKRAWKAKLHPGTRDQAELREAWNTFIFKYAGVFPQNDDSEFWTRNLHDKVQAAIAKVNVSEPRGPSENIPL